MSMPTQGRSAGKATKSQKYTGVYHQASGRWRAQFCHGGLVRRDQIDWLPCLLFAVACLIVARLCWRPLVPVCMDCAEPPSPHSATQLFPCTALYRPVVPPQVHQLGMYDSEEEAAQAWDRVAWVYRGRAAELNFPDLVQVYDTPVSGHLRNQSASPHSGGDLQCAASKARYAEL